MRRGCRFLRAPSLEGWWPWSLGAGAHHHMWGRVHNTPPVNGLPAGGRWRGREFLVLLAHPGRLCRRGTDESISSLDHGLALAVSVAPYMGSVVARERVSHRGLFRPVPGSPPGCGYGGVDQIWPSEIPARFEQATPRWASHSRLGKGGFRFV